jgi:hypothetical protein
MKTYDIFQNSAFKMQNGKFPNLKTNFKNKFFKESKNSFICKQKNEFFLLDDFFSWKLFEWFTLGTFDFSH